MLNEKIIAEYLLETIKEINQGVYDNSYIVYSGERYPDWMISKTVIRFGNDGIKIYHNCNYLCLISDLTDHDEIKNQLIIAVTRILTKIKNGHV